MLSSIIRMEKQIYRVKWPRFLALLTWENMIRSLPYWLLILGFSNLVYYKYFKLKMYCNKLTSKARIVWNMLVERALDCSICFCHISFSHSPPWWICYSFTAVHPYCLLVVMTHLIVIWKRITFIMLLYFTWMY